MIAARPFQDLTRGLGRNAFDLPVAALAGLAAAFVAFAMPADLLGQLVSATGLPHLLAAAEPPLGLKARGAIGIAGAGAAFGLAYMLMRLLDKSGRERARPEFETDEDRPRLRRRDLHPDAPVCRPISATRDCGEPAPPPQQRPEPVPVWSTEPVQPMEVDEQPAPAWSAEPEEALELRDHHAPAWLAEREPESEPEPLAQEPESRPEAVNDASLPDLMRRLEQGLARRRTREVFAQAPQQPPAPQVFPEADDDRLQSAIESLQRFASRGE
jgi:hypothetical protein